MEGFSMNSQKIGNFVREKLKSKGITQEVFAERLNKTASAISQKLNGEISFVIDELVIISEIIGTSVDTILQAGSSINSELFNAVKKGLDSVKVLEKNGVQLDSLGAIDIAIEQDKEDIVEYLVFNNWYKDGLHKSLNYLTYIFKKHNHKLVQFVYYDNSKSTKWILHPSKIELPSLAYVSLHTALVNQQKISTYLVKEHLEILTSTIKSGLEFAKIVPYFEKTSSNKVEESIVDIFMLIAIEMDHLELFKYYKTIEKPSTIGKRNSYFYNNNTVNVSREVSRYAILCKSFVVTNFIYKDKMSYDKSMEIIESNDAEFFSKFDYGRIDQPYHSKMLLSRAVELGNINLVELLIENADIQSKYEAMEHVREGDLPMIKYLLSKGSSFSSADYEGGNRTPLVGITNAVKIILDVKNTK
jgi:transcriptional regulator with XRE-family HTH domain